MTSQNLIVHPKTRAAAAAVRAIRDLVDAQPDVRPAIADLLVDVAFRHLLAGTEPGSLASPRLDGIVAEAMAQGRAAVVEVTS